MNIPREAIKKAIERGWQPFKTVEVSVEGTWEKIDFQTYSYARPAEEFGTCRINIYRIALDPSFWQALGKALGWEKKVVIRRGTVIGNFCTPCSSEHPRGECFKEMGFNMDYLDPWVYYAHRFYEQVLTGGDTDAYWQELLTQ